MIGTLLSTLRHPRTWIECLAERRLEHDSVYRQLRTEGEAADRSTIQIRGHTRYAPSRDPITASVRGDYRPRARRTRRGPR